MPVFTDQLRRKIELENYPERIVCLVPSITELLYDLGLENEVIGITKFCVHPEAWFKKKTKIGGTKNVRIDVVASLQPQLIIANKEENVKAQVEKLETIAPVFITDVNNLNDAIEMIEQIGLITGKAAAAQCINQKINNTFAKLEPVKNSLRVCYLIWKDPYMAAGSQTFINDMLYRCGFKNVFDDRARYPQITLQELALNHCDVVLLSSEPYPFSAKHIADFQAALPSAKIILVDGEMFSWYGSRLQFSAAYFLKLLKALNVADGKP